MTHSPRAMGPEDRPRTTSWALASDEVKHLIIKGKEVDLTNKQTPLYEKYMSRQ